MSTKLHPTIAHAMLDNEGRTRNSESDRALDRATGKPADTGKATDESGEDKLARAAEQNDTGGPSAGKQRAS